ncbi:MAG: hypothetical protein Q7S18_01865, partial [bacterium]|nr:hypothetical protein [bacterium]
AVFDIKKLDWINNQYIKKLTIDELCEKSLEFFEQKVFYISWKAEHETWSEKNKKEYLKKVLTVEQGRLVSLSQAGEGDQYFFKDNFNYSKDDTRWKKSSDNETEKSLEKSLKVLEDISDWEKEKIEEVLLKEAGDKRGDLLFPLRWALTGQKFSPTPFEVAWVLGKEESAKRIKKGIALFQ